jgi:hypothetical protein
MKPILLAVLAVLLVPDAIAKGQCCCEPPKPQASCYVGPACAPGPTYSSCYVPAYCKTVPSPIQPAARGILNDHESRLRVIEEKLNIDQDALPLKKTGGWYPIYSHEDRIKKAERLLESSPKRASVAERSTHDASRPSKPRMHSLNYSNDSTALRI